MISPGTVGKILTAAAPSTAREEMLEALILAHAYGLHDNRDFCVRHGSDAQGENLDLFIEEGGASLSGGQRQYLAIARALIRRPWVPIPDGPTPTLDSNTEAQILSGLRKTYPEMTLVLITHRMEVAASADEIVCLCGGETHSFGTPTEVIGVSSQPVFSQETEKQ